MSLRISQAKTKTTTPDTLVLAPLFFSVFLPVPYRNLTARRQALTEGPFHSFNRDGNPDLAFINSADAKIIVLLTNPSLFAEGNCQQAVTSSSVDPGSPGPTAIAAGDIDLGIVLGPLVDAGSGGSAPEAVVYQRLQAESLVLALPQSHAHAMLTTPVALAKFAHEAFISFPRHAAPGLHDAITGACSDAGFSQRVVQEAIQMQTIISLVSAGMGVALVPESLMRLQRSGVVYRKLRGGNQAALEIGLVWRRDDASAVLKRFTRLAVGKAGNN